MRSRDSTDRFLVRAQSSAFTGKKDQPRQWLGCVGWRICTPLSPASGGSRQSRFTVKLP